MAVDQPIVIHMHLDPRLTLRANWTRTPEYTALWLPRDRLSVQPGFLGEPNMIRSLRPGRLDLSIFLQAGVTGMPDQVLALGAAADGRGFRHLAGRP